MKKVLTKKKTRRYNKKGEHRKKPMTKEQKIIIGLISGVIIILGFLTFALNGKNVERIQKKVANNQGPIPKVSLIPTQVPKKAETIMVSSTGFIPNKITVTSGTAVNFANFSGNPIDIESEGDKTLVMNIGVVANGDTTEQKPLLRGSYGYYNKFHPNQKGTIIVQ